MDSKKPEWPDETRIDHIGQNGNDGLHYESDTMSELLAFVDIREAIGDPEGKLMQSEVVERVRELVAQNAQMNTALNNCALKFREYARLHAAKLDHPKALANMEMAWLAEAVMSKVYKVDDVGTSSILREEKAQTIEEFVESVQRDSLHKATLISVGKLYANRIRQGKR